MLVVRLFLGPGPHTVTLVWYAIFDQEATGGIYGHLKYSTRSKNNRQERVQLTNPFRLSASKSKVMVRYPMKFYVSVSEILFYDASNVHPTIMIENLSINQNVNIS